MTYNLTHQIPQQGHNHSLQVFLLEQPEFGVDINLLEGIMEYLEIFNNSSMLLAYPPETIAFSIM